MAIGDAPSGERMLKHVNESTRNANATAPTATTTTATTATTRSTAPTTESRHLLHPGGFRMSIRRSLIEHPAAGYGVFVDDDVPAGTLLALYPGSL